MLITNETPALTWSISGASGSVWTPAAPFAQLTNGKPRVGSRMIRASGTAGFTLRAQWTTASRPRVVALLGLGEEWAGLSVGLTASNIAGGGGAIDLGTHEVVRLPDDSLAVFALVTIGSNVDSVDVVCGTFTGAGYTIGEVVIATAEEWQIRRDWVESVTILSRQNVSSTGQPSNVRRNQQRKARVTIAPQLWSKAVSVAAVQTLQRLQARLSRYQSVLVIPALRPPGLGASAPIDTDTAFASALFGTCSDVGQISLVDGSNLAELQLSFTEAPAGRVN